MGGAAVWVDADGAKWLRQYADKQILLLKRRKKGGKSNMTMIQKGLGSPDGTKNGVHYKRDEVALEMDLTRCSA